VDNQWVTIRSPWKSIGCWLGFIMCLRLIWRTNLSRWFGLLLSNKIGYPLLLSLMQLLLSFVDVFHSPRGGYARWLPCYKETSNIQTPNIAEVCELSRLQTSSIFGLGALGKELESLGQPRLEIDSSLWPLHTICLMLSPSSFPLIHGMAEPHQINQPLTYRQSRSVLYTCASSPRPGSPGRQQCRVFEIDSIWSSSRTDRVAFMVKK